LTNKFVSELGNRSQVVLEFADTHVIDWTRKELEFDRSVNDRKIHYDACHTFTSPLERHGGTLDAHAPDRFIETEPGRGHNQSARNRAARSQVSKENHTDPPSDRHGGRN
jgi:hypothetical protein